jgi:hypothetical protein
MLVLVELFGPVAAEPAAPSPPVQAQAHATIVDLQPFRTDTRVAVQRADNQAGTATLTNLNPHVGAWYLLALDWSATREPETYHLENPRPGSQLSVHTGPRGTLLLGFGDRSSPCTLALAGAPGQQGALEMARASELPYAPICDGRLYVRNRTTGRASSLEKVTDFLRDHVWGGEKIVTLVKKEVFRDAFLEQGETRAAPGGWTPPESAPAGALVEPADADLAVMPSHLGLEVESATPQLLLGRWYALRGLPNTYLSALMPGVVARGILYGHEASVNPLDATESKALVYLVAFDLAKYDLRFSLGTEHPRLGWSPRPPPDARDPRLPGPDGIDSPAPLAITGMVSPAEQAGTVAAFAGGFKREHGAFRFGPLAERNHGSHYGFVEQGVVFSKLQPGLATVFTTTAGEVQMGTWTDADDAVMAGIRDARQNGVALVDFDPRTGVSTPGALVNRWGEGNWSGSANEDLRTVRAGLCLQETGARRFLIFAYFSAATPSAMARVFQAYHCRYAMHLDMNALEHTYLAVYASQEGRRTVEHLIDGMDVLDRHAGDQLAPRFVGFPDDRDFFYLIKRATP